MSRTMLRYDFSAQLENMLPGERLVYHTGNMMEDRCHGAEFLRVHATAKAAWDAMEQGKVYLVQKRVLKNVFEYTVIMRAPPWNAVEWTGCYDPHRTDSAPPKALATYSRKVDASVERQHGKGPVQAVA